MRQKRIQLLLLSAITCTILAFFSFVPSTAQAATLANPHVTQHLTHMTGQSGALTHTLAPMHQPAVTPLINRVSDSACASRTDFFKLWNNTTIAGGVCFASNGTVFVNIFNVFKITTGNNAGFVVDSNGDTFPFAGGVFCQGVTANISPAIPDVVQITITGRTC